MDTNLIISEIKGKLPIRKLGKAAIAEITNRLDSLNDRERSDAFLKIQESNIKSLIFVDLCNLFVGNLGVARFMIGDYVIGGIRLALLILYCVFYNSGIACTKITDGLFAILWFWWFFDLFAVERKVRMQNLRKVLLAIDSVKNQSKQKEDK